MTNQQIYDLILNILAFTVILPFIGLFFTKEARVFFKDVKFFWGEIFKRIKEDRKLFLNKSQNVRIYIVDEFYSNNVSEKVVSPVKPIQSLIRRNIPLPIYRNDNIPESDDFQIRFATS